VVQGWQSPSEVRRARGGIGTPHSFALPLLRTADEHGEAGEAAPDSELTPRWALLEPRIALMVALSVL
jgi:hypothetical protein